MMKNKQTKEIQHSVSSVFYVWFQRLFVWKLFLLLCIIHHTVRIVKCFTVVVQ